VRLFYTLLLWLSDHELTRALNAPVRNTQYIELLRGDVDRWERALEDAEIKARFN
jgi:hypothetical protein